MSSILIKNIEIIDKNSPLNGKKTSIFINSEGVIKSIGNANEIADKTIEGNGYFASIGFMDMRTNIGEPGFEHKESIASVCKAATFGGFTAIAALPNTLPVLQSKDAISYVLNTSKNDLVDIFPIAAITMNMKGEELTEMMELNQFGAVAFCDANHCLSHSGVFVRALQYMKTFNGLLMQHPEDQKLTMFGQMNEGITSTYLGLKGIPAIAEEIIIQRDIKLLEYAGTGRLHFSRISTKKAVEIIKKAKEKGVKITCDVAVAHLVLNEEKLIDFDTNYKLNPPLRTKIDQAALWDGINDGTIDVIVTDHEPQDTESKNLEFDMAENGMIALETAFSLLIKYKPQHVDIQTIIDKITVNPRELLHIPVPRICEGQKANLTIWENKEWEFKISDIKSKSKNTPFVGETFPIKIIGVINGNKNSF